MSLHYYEAAATTNVMEYFVRGGREFNVIKSGTTGQMVVRFMATESYVEKMKERPFLRGVRITIKA